MAHISVIFLGLCLVLVAMILVSVKVYQINKDFIIKLLKYFIIAVFFVIFSITAIVIGFRISERHDSSYNRSFSSVQSIWGGQISQSSPMFYYLEQIVEEVEDTKTGKWRKITKKIQNELGFEEQSIELEIKANIRKKGILQFPGYQLRFKGEYRIKNLKSAGGTFYFSFPLPEFAGNITELNVKLDGTTYKKDTNLADGIDWSDFLKPGEERVFLIQYQAQGTSKFLYALEKRQIEIKKLKIVLNTDYVDIKLPERSMVPTINQNDSNKTHLEWESNQLITGQNIALSFDISGNYGQYAAKLFFYSPLALFLFIILILIFSIGKEIYLHPMNFLFFIVSFFIFYLLSSYLFSYMHILLAVLLSLLISTGILIYYTVLIKKGKDLIKLCAIAIFIFQWIFSIAFFFPEHTGLIITITAIIAFVIIMRLTSNTNWEKKW